MIRLLYTAYLITGAMCNGDANSLNITTLYPVKNDNVHIKENGNLDNVVAKSGSEYKAVPLNEEHITDDSKENEFTKESLKGRDKTTIGVIKNDHVTTIQDHIENNTNNNENKKLPTFDVASWKIDTSFSNSKPKKPENFIGDSKKYSRNKTSQSSDKDFRPSPQLGYFDNEDTFVVPTQSTRGSFSPMENPNTFLSSPQDFFKLNYKTPISNPDPLDFPYKFENTVLSRNKEWKYSSGIQPVPKIKVPAGGLYKHPDAFKEKPSSDGDDENFGLDFKDEEKGSKENPVKKRGNPWESVLHLVTALLPLGIILSALSPNIITIEGTGNNHQFRKRSSPRRRSGAPAPPAPPALTESCKRRLLCEIHSDHRYYAQLVSPRRQNHCYKIQCEDTQALSELLHWLLFNSESRKHRPELHDRRGVII